MQRVFVSLLKSPCVTAVTCSELMLTKNENAELKIVNNEPDPKKIYNMK